LTSSLADGDPGCWDDENDDAAAAPTTRYTMTDKGNAEMIVSRFGADLCWCGTMSGGGWMSWTGTRWEPDSTREATRDALQIGQMWRATAPSAPAGSESPEDVARLKRRQAILRHADRSESSGSIRAMLDLAGPMLSVRREQFDRDDMLLTTPTRTYDCSRWAQRNPEPGDYITRAAAVDAGGDCPLWLEFLDTIMGGDQEMVAFLRRAVGYCLTGLISENCVFIAHGSGANGKSTFMDTISYLMGDYATTTSVETFMARKPGGIPNDLAALAGARLVSCSETPEGGALDEGRIKEISGGDMISARFLHSEFFTFKPKFKLWILTNHKPVIRGTDNGIWRRIRLVPFEVTIPMEKRDKDLPTKLRAEAPGILAWALSGLREWRGGGLRPPQRVEEATDAYKGEMDILGDFIEEMCLTGDMHRVSNGMLYGSYSQWAKDNGLMAKSHKWFSRALMDRGLRQLDSRKDGGRMWASITLR